ncbi:hypothetical protein [Alistipes sp.]|uniref:hypothetical protein n=1 Tax=Alistipes sp. TaxID=1872444 RepID=UPI003AF0F772
MKAMEVPRRPDYSGALRRMRKGETLVFKMLGTTYNALGAARRRLEKSSVGRWTVEVDTTTNRMTITRLS